MAELKEYYDIRDDRRWQLQAAICLDALLKRIKFRACTDDALQRWHPLIRPNESKPIISHAHRRRQSEFTKRKDFSQNVGIPRGGEATVTEARYILPATVSFCMARYGTAAEQRTALRTDSDYTCQKKVRL